MTRWVTYNRSYTRGWGSSKVEVWDCLPVAAARLSRASRLPTPEPATHCSGDWKPQPAPEAPCFQATRFQEAQQKTPTQPLYCGIPAIQALTTPWALM